MPYAGRDIRWRTDSNFPWTGLANFFSRSYVIKYDAIWFVPPGAIELDLEAGLLIRLELHSNLFRRPVGVTTCARRHEQQSAKLFARILTEVSAELALAQDAHHPLAPTVDTTTRNGRPN